MSDENNINEKQKLDYDKENHPNTIEYRRLQAEIEKHKQSIIERMEKLHFTQEEKQEILDVIEYHRILKDASKIPLINVNENVILDEIENKVKENSKKIAENMLKVANQKIKKIMDRKLNK